MICTAHPIESLRKIKGEYKVVHLIRHAQGQFMSVGIPSLVFSNTFFTLKLFLTPIGTHNLAILNLGGIDGGPEEEYKNWKWYDARLTPLGEEQSRDLRPYITAFKLEVVITSPLSRTIQTGLHAIPSGVPFVVEDDCRERIGVHPCDKRRSKTELAADFPSINLDLLLSEEDDKWTDVREPFEDLKARCERFLEKLRLRPETHIAVVTHNDFLTSLLYESDLRLADQKLQKKFFNADSMPIVLTWSNLENGAGAEA
jgi:broad specificity phosphatase PhoE